jgi:hypothetical protein
MPASIAVARKLCSAEKLDKGRQRGRLEQFYEKINQTIEKLIRWTGIGGSRCERPARA